MQTVSILLWSLGTHLAAAQPPAEAPVAWDASCDGSWSGTIHAPELSFPVTLRLKKPTSETASCGRLEEEFPTEVVAMPCHMDLLKCSGGPQLAAIGRQILDFDCGRRTVEFSCTTGELTIHFPGSTDPTLTAKLRRSTEEGPTPEPSSEEAR